MRRHRTAQKTGYIERSGGLAPIVSSCPQDALVVAMTESLTSRALCAGYIAQRIGKQYDYPGRIARFGMGGGSGHARDPRQTLWE